MNGLFKWILINQSDLSNYQLSEGRDPNGWNELALKLYRSERYHGVFLEPTNKQLGFFKDGGGYEFLESIFATDDINANVLLVCKYRPHKNAEYSTQFVFKLDFKSYRIEDRILWLSLEQSDLYSKMLGRESIPVDLETTESIGGATITAPATTTVSLPGQVVRMATEWRIANNYDTSDAMTTTGNLSTKGFFTPLAELNSRDFEISQPLPGYIQWSVDNQIDINNEGSSIFPMLSLANAGFNSPVTLNYEINFSGEWQNYQTTGPTGRDLQTMKLILYYGKRTNPITTLNTIELYSYGGLPTAVDIGNGVAGTGQTFTINTSGTFTLNVGESVWLSWFVIVQNYNGVDTIFQEFYYDASTFKLWADTQLEATDCKTILVHEAFNQVADAIADTDGNFYSDWYGRTDSDKITYAANGDGSLKAYTNGGNIRLRNKPILHSLQSIFDDCHAVDNIGLSIVNNKMRVEKMDFFYATTTRVIQLPNVRKIRTTLSEKHYYNSIKVGYAKYSTESIAGLDEPNTVTTYKTKVSTVNGKYEKLSNSIASSYAIEATRRKNINITTEDWRFDEENFWLVLNSDYTVELLADAFDSGSGMVAIDTAYNLRITPARNLLNHFRVIAGGLQTIGGQIAFVTKPGNQTLVTDKTSQSYQIDYNSVDLPENNSFAYNDGNIYTLQPYWKPFIDSFEYPLTPTEWETIAANPHGFIEYYEEPTDIRRGFIMEVNYKLMSGRAEFKLLRMIN